MPDLPEFSGFDIIEVLPTGDQRKIHEININRDLHGATMLLECNGHTVDEKKFPFGTDPNEMHVWLQEVMEEHEGSCPIEDEEVMDETETPVQDAIDAINKVINVHENHLYPKDAQAFTAALERLEGLKAANDDWK